MHSILWGSESCDSNKDEYDRRNALCLWNPRNHCFENTAPSQPQSCAAVSATPFRSMVTIGHNATVCVYNRIPTEWEETAKLRSEGDMLCDQWFWCWAQSILPLGCLWRLWWCASTLTQPFCPDGNVFCWWVRDDELSENCVSRATVEKLRRKSALLSREMVAGWFSKQPLIR